MFARQLANKGESVIYIQTGDLAYPLDIVGDYITDIDVNNLKKLGCQDVHFNTSINSRYVFMPYNDLKFVNSTNGLVSYPINKLSLESAEEFDDLMACAEQLPSLMARLKDSTNFISAYKNFFPKWLYDSLLKHIGVNKWGMRQSKLSRSALIKSFELERLRHTGTGIIYKPDISYSDICDLLLIHPNIKRETSDIDKMKSFMIARHKNLNIHFMDNRIDVLTGYSYGQFDRIKLTSELTSEHGMEEFYDVSNGIVFTPLKPYWCAINTQGSVRKLFSETFDRTNDFTITELVPSINNAKLKEEYKNLLVLYAGKKLNLSKYVNTVIL